MRTWFRLRLVKACFVAMLPLALASQVFGQGELWSSFAGEEAVLDIGGWFQGGYHSASTGLFNSTPDRVNLHQGWLYMQKAADPTENGVGFGGRVDFMYGIDAADTQAFGGTGWDTTWNFGNYGWAIPQLYAEVATENISIKAGHFFTLVGYEVVTAPDNFFYSHAYTMYNSEPFTHTGLVSTITMTENLTVYAGWTAGWDTGFESVDGGSNFLGGFGLTLTENASFTYITTIGNFGARSAGNNGYGHSCLFNFGLTDNLTYIFQTDMLRVDATGETNIGINQYLLYTITEDFGVGARMEWWQANDVTGFDYGGQSAAPVDTTSYYEFTVGVNAQLTERSRIRPEFRLDWSPALDYEQGIFGIDWITVY